VSLSDPRKVVEDVFVGNLDPTHLDLRGELLDRLDREDSAFLEVHFAGLPRKAGRELLTGVGVVKVGSGHVDLSVYRVCDLFAADLLPRIRTTDGFLDRLYRQGDAEERRMVLRSLPFAVPGASVVRLMEEAHRTNDEVLFESGTLDSDLASRTLEEDAWNRVVLKCAFLDQPKERLIGWATRGNRALSMMLFDFMTERQAAGRLAWLGTASLCALAPESLLERLPVETDPERKLALERLVSDIATV